LAIEYKHNSIGGFMVQKRAKIEAEWDDELESKFEEKAESWAKTCGKKNYGSSSGGGAVYGMGFVGALIYYISIAPDFWAGVLGVLKAIVWPGFLVYDLLKFLGQ